MRFSIIGLALLAAGCAMTPNQMAQQSNWDVCRFSMGGPHSRVAQYEAQRRSLDCAPLYPAIAAKMQADTAATNALIQQLNRPPQPAPQFPRTVHCTSQRHGAIVTTTCD